MFKGKRLMWKTTAAVTHKFTDSANVFLLHFNSGVKAQQEMIFSTAFTLQALFNGYVER